MDGPHSIEVCEDVTNRALDAVFAELNKAGVALNGMVLKPNMVISGTEASDRAGPQEVAEATVRCLTAHVPAEVPGIAFLSGGQTAEEATEHLSIMNTLGPHPWELSFSYGRALQAPALSAWQGKGDQYDAGQQALFKRAKLNGLARSGSYNNEMETAA
jgi:fructose-bisphosphate aldolase class I